MAAARSARYMQQAAQLASHNHHHSLQLGPAGAEPEPNVVQGDKGRRKPEWARWGQHTTHTLQQAAPVHD